MRRRLAAACLAFALAGPALAQQPAGEPQFPPGASIGLAPLPGMAPATQFQGFQNEDNGAVVGLFELPRDAFEQLSAQYAPEGLAAQGFAPGATREAIAIAGADEAFLVVGDQRIAQTATVRKYVVVARGAERTALAIGQVLSVGQGYGEAEMRALMGSLAFRAPLTIEEQIGALPFAVGDEAGFRAVRVTGGNSVLYTEGEDNVVEAADQPIVIVAGSVGVAPLPDAREDFARRALLGLQGLSDVSIERAESFEAEGAAWHEIVATAKERAGVPVVVQQTIRFHDDGFIRAVAVAKADERDLWTPRFRRLFLSMEPR